MVDTPTNTARGIVLPLSLPTVFLETHRLVLREFALQDAPFIPALIAEETREAIPDEALRRIDEQRLAVPRLRYDLAITAKPDAVRVIGWLPLRLREPIGSGEGEIGWSIAPEFREQGIATEAARAGLTLLLQTLRCRGVIARCPAENLASCRVAEKIGMTPLTEPAPNGDRVFVIESGNP